MLLSQEVSRAFGMHGKLKSDFPAWGVGWGCLYKRDPGGLRPPTPALREQAQLPHRFISTLRKTRCGEKEHPALLRTGPCLSLLHKLPIFSAFGTGWGEGRGPGASVPVTSAGAGLVPLPASHSFQ